MAKPSAPRPKGVRRGLQSRYDLRPIRTASNNSSEQGRYYLRSGLRKNDNGGGQQLQSISRPPVKGRKQPKSGKKPEKVKLMGSSFSKLRVELRGAIRKLADAPWKFPKKNQNEKYTDPGRKTPSTASDRYSLSHLRKRTKQNDLSTSIAPSMASATSTNSLILSRLEQLRIQQADIVVGCLACMDEMPEEKTVRAPCKEHFYCKSCLRTLYQLATKEEAEYPPSCCNEKFANEVAEIALASDDLHLYKEAVHEYETPMDRRIYCPTEDCKKFVATSDIDGSGTGKNRCKHCNTDVCTYCKKLLHDGECPEDAGLKSLLILAKQENWKQCQKCSAMVMKIDGCSWMICLCSNQFCYTCGVTYQKTGHCGCAERTWDAQAHIHNIVAGN